MVYGPTITGERRLRIILLEDEPALVCLFVELMRDWHPDVDLVAVQHGDDAWRELSQREVDLFITDCIHPGPSGFKILLRLADQKAGFPILWTSSIGPDESAQYLEVLKRSSLNVTRLPKPFSPQELQTVISRLLKRNRVKAVVKRISMAGTGGKTRQRNPCIGDH